MLLLPAVYCCRYAMQRDVYATHSSRDRAGICSSFAFKVIHCFFRHTPKMRFSSCYNKWSVGYFGLKLNRHILGTPKINITSCKKGHNRCPLKTIACEQSALFDEYSMMQEQWIKPIMNQTSNQIKQHFLTIVLRWSLQQNCGERIVEKLLTWWIACIWSKV